MELFAPEGYWSLTEEYKDKICNGCGAKGFTSWLVPDTMWGLDIEICCNIHDYMYTVGETQTYKEVADRVFLNNLLRVIDSGSRWLKPLRRRRARTYYFFVKNFGGPAYWAGKNKPEELGGMN